MALNCIYNFAANHKGWFEFRICPNNNIHKVATHECLDKHLLELADGSGTRLPILPGQEHLDVKLKLPTGLTCEQCVFQWKYHTGTLFLLEKNWCDITKYSVNMTLKLPRFCRCVPPLTSPNHANIYVRCFAFDLCVLGNLKHIVLLWYIHFVHVIKAWRHLNYYK